MQAFALPAEQHQYFDRVLVGAAEPVGSVGVELGDLTGRRFRSTSPRTSRSRALAKTGHSRPFCVDRDGLGFGGHNGSLVPGP